METLFIHVYHDRCRNKYLTPKTKNIFISRWEWPKTLVVISCASALPQRLREQNKTIKAKKVIMRIQVAHHNAVDSMDAAAKHSRHVLKTGQRLACEFKSTRETTCSY